MKTKDLRTKKTRMICAVKGCGERITFFLAKSGDFAGSPNLCADCIKKAFASICAESEPETVQNIEAAENDKEVDVSEASVQTDAKPEAPSSETEIEGKDTKSSKKKTSDKAARKKSAK